MQEAVKAELATLNQVGARQAVGGSLRNGLAIMLGSTCRCCIMHSS